MSPKLLKIIAAAAARANDQITEIHLGRYRPKTPVVTVDDTLESLARMVRLHVPG